MLTRKAFSVSRATLKDFLKNCNKNTDDQVRTPVEIKLMSPPELVEYSVFFGNGIHFL
jgi:hypothetical protein